MDSIIWRLERFSRCWTVLAFYRYKLRKIMKI